MNVSRMDPVFLASNLFLLGGPQLGDGPHLLPSCTDRNTDNILLPPTSPHATSCGLQGLLVLLREWHSDPPHLWSTYCVRGAAVSVLGGHLLHRA